MGEAINKKERARRAGLNPNTVRKRIDRGWSEEDALSIPPRQVRIAHSTNPVSVHKRQHQRANQHLASMLLGKPVSQPVARKFLKDLRLAIAAKPNRRLSDLSILPRAAGLTLEHVRARLHHGWSKERALSEPPRWHKDSLSRRARQVGLDPSLVHSRVRAGWSEDRALRTPPLA